MSKDDTSMVTCKLDQPIRSKLFDQNVSVESFKLTHFFKMEPFHHVAVKTHHL